MSSAIEISVQELKEKLKTAQGPALIDVREPWEFEESKIESARNVPLHTILDELDSLGDKSEELIVYCRTGARGRTACAVLTQNGFKIPKNLEGGITAFQEA